MCEVNQDKIWRHFQGDGIASFAASHPRLRYLVRQAGAQRAPAGVRLLNIGVGDGYLERRAISAGFDVNSLDPDREAIGRVCKMGSCGVTGVIESMPFESEQFDVVIASEVLEHLSAPQRQQGLREVARILKPQGRFLGTTPYNEDLALGRTVCPCCGEVFHRWGHQASFDLLTMRKELDQTFVIERLVRTCFPDFEGQRILGWVKGTLRIALAKFGQQIASPSLYFAVHRNAKRLS